MTPFFHPLSFSDSWREMRDAQCVATIAAILHPPMQMYIFKQSLPQLNKFNFNNYILNIYEICTLNKTLQSINFQLESVFIVREGAFFECLFLTFPPFACSLIPCERPPPYFITIFFSFCRQKHGYKIYLNEISKKLRNLQIFSINEQRRLRRNSKNDGIFFDIF